MKRILVPLAIALAAAASGAWAKAPAGSTGECKDGTYTTSAQKEGACSSHGGVKKWLAKEDKADKSSAKSAAAEKSSGSAAKADRPKVAAATDAAKPADATGQCKDGSFTTSPSKSGACSGHKGVKNWYGNMAQPSAAQESKSSATPSSARPSSMNAPSTTSAPSTGSSRSASTPASEKTAAAGGGAGKVWVNTDSKVYHCQKDALYGKTKQGEYMTESQAKAAGARPSRGKECS